MSSDRDILGRIRALGVDYERLKAALDSHDAWGGLVHSFEYLTVLGVVCDAMRDYEDMRQDEG